MDRTRRILLISIGVLFLILTVLLVGNKLLQPSENDEQQIMDTSAEYLDNSMTQNSPTLDYGVAGEIARLIQQAEQLAQNEDYVAALDMLKSAMELNPTDEERNRIMDLYKQYLDKLRQKDAETGTQRDYTIYDNILDTSLDDNYDTIESLIRQARTVALDNQYARAIEILEDAEALNPTDEQQNRIDSFKENFLTLLKNQSEGMDADLDAMDPEGLEDPDSMDNDPLNNPQTDETNTQDTSSPNATYAQADTSRSNNNQTATQTQQQTHTPSTRPSDRNTNRTTTTRPTRTRQHTGSRSNNRGSRGRREPNAPNATQVSSNNSSNHSQNQTDPSDSTNATPSNPSHSNENTTPAASNNTQADTEDSSHSTDSTPTIEMGPLTEDPKSVEEVTELITIEERTISDLFRDPNAAVELTRLGINEMNRGNYERAERLFKQAIFANPNFSQAYSNLSNAQLRQNKLQEARSNAERALQNNDKDTMALTTMGEVAYQLNNPNNARRYFNRALSINPSLVIPNYRMGVIALRNHQYSSAKDYFQDTLDIMNSTGDPEAEKLNIPCYSHYNLAFAMNRMNESEDAIYHLNESLEIDPQHSKSLILRAEIQYKLAMEANDSDLFQEAVTSLTIAIKQNPNDFHAQFLLGKAYDRLGNPDKAEQAYREALRIDPQDYEAYFNLGRIQRQRDETQAAIESLQTALRLDQSDPEVYAELADILYDQDELGQTITLCKNGLQLDASNTNLRFLLANSLYRSNKNSEALMHVNTLLAYDRDHTAGQELKSRLEADSQ